VGLSAGGEDVTFQRRWRRDEPNTEARILDNFTPANNSASVKLAKNLLSGIRVFQLNPQEIARQVPLQPNAELDRHGFGLAGVLDHLRDQHPEKFEILNRELASWLPEFDRILFEVPSDGARAFSLRLRHEKVAIPAKSLSDGTITAVALLTLAHLPNPPTFIGLEEPDQGIHPRLLRHVQDAIYRLAYPEYADEEREPVQVIVTTHSPYFLDLFKDSPEEIVTMDKDDAGVRFNRLADRPSLNDILPEGALGELWYSGLLGGVPAQS
jgi:predicted ATPase